MIYLDSAATSLMKPPGVAKAMEDAMAAMSSAGRGGHIYARRAAEKVYECRENLAKLCSVEKPENIVFCFNATHALNLAINSLVSEGDRVLVSGYEHNSVMRPLYAIGADVIEISTPLFRPDLFMQRAHRLIDSVDAVICTHVSNVFGYILPVYELGKLCREKGKPFIVDASQSAGTLELDFKALGADFVAFPGHKGLMGPQGTGVLICKNEAKPLLYGGSGSSSLLPGMPEELPERLEAGTQNTAGIAGLNEGVKFILKKGVGNIHRHEKMLVEEFLCPLRGERGIRIFADEKGLFRSGLVSVIPEDMSCESMGEKLEKAGIAVRTGLHCAPAAHRTAGTLTTGSVRFSFSPFISAAQARTASHALKKILKKA